MVDPFLFLPISFQLFTTSAASTDVTAHNALDRLDDFNLLTILDYVRLVDLLAIGSMGQRYRDLVTKHFLIPIYHFDAAKITISIDNHVYLGEDDVDGEPTPYVAGLNQTLTLLQTFGHIFGHLHIKVKPHGYKFIGNIAAAVNQHCAMAEQTVTLHRGTAITTDHSPFSFANATILQIRHINAAGFVETLRLNAAFPRLQQLDLDLGSNLTFLHQHFPHMRQFALRSSFSVDDAANLREFFRLNAQLRRIRTPLFFNPDYLADINKLLPALESLTIKNLNSHVYVRDAAANHSVRFKNVRHFTLDLFTYNCKWNGALRDRLSAIEFVGLESYAVTSNVDDSTDYLIGLIVRNAAVQRVKMTSTELDGDQLTRLLAGLAELKELTVGWRDQSTRAVLWQFMSDALVTKVQKVNVLVLEHRILYAEHIFETVPGGWKHSGTRPVGTTHMVHFERL